MSIDVQFQVKRGSFVLDASVSMPGAGVTAIYGPTGCGKTTLLRAIAGLDRHERGRLRVGDAVWQDDGVFVPPHKRGVGYVFQEASLLSHLTVRGNLEYGFKRVPDRERTVGLDEAVSLLGLAGMFARRPDELSGGERQRVAIARALLASPKLLLMDEPLTGLDPVSKGEVLPFLSRLHHELDMPILYVSHALDEVSRLADHLVLMETGRVVADGSLTDMLTRVDLPLARADTAESVFEASVSGHDDTYGLTYLGFAGGTVSVAGQDVPVGTAVRLRVHARDVSLTLEPQSGTSILNILPARVNELASAGPSQVVVQLDVGGSRLLARVTRKSSETLGLTVGTAVFAQIKSVAVLT